MDTIKYFAMLLTAVIISGTGELLLKYGMNQVGEISLHPDTIATSLLRTFTTPFVLLGFVFIFGGSIVWLAIISKVQLSYAYPMLSLGYIFVVGVSWLVLNEQFPPTRLVGVLVIVLGVIIVSRT